MNHHALTTVVFGLNHAVDTGKYDDLTIDEVVSHVGDGTILSFLRDRLGRDIDLSIHLDTSTYGDFNAFLVKRLQSHYNAYGTSKVGVENKGLCLLIAWLVEIIQQGTGWRPNEVIPLST